MKQNVISPRAKPQNCNSSTEMSVQPSVSAELDMNFCSHFSILHSTNTHTHVCEHTYTLKDISSMRMCRSNHSRRRVHHMQQQLQLEEAQNCIQIVDVLEKWQQLQEEGEEEGAAEEDDDGGLS